MKKERFEQSDKSMTFNVFCRNELENMIISSKLKKFHSLELSLWIFFILFWINLNKALTKQLDLHV